MAKETKVRTIDLQMVKRKNNESSPWVRDLSGKLLNNVGSAVANRLANLGS